MPAPDHPFFANHQEIWNRIEQAALDRVLNQQEAMDVAFHMLDWHEDLAGLVSFLQNPEDVSVKGLQDLLDMFLLHAPNHIAAAAKLFTGNGVRDIFGVGVCDD
jgi:hypothetical protein